MQPNSEPQQTCQGNASRTLSRSATMMTYAILSTGLLVSPAITAPRSLPNAKQCQRVEIDGEARSGQSFEANIGEGLELALAPRLGSEVTGWVIRIRPVQNKEEDYSEAATPPFQSVNPRLLTTDYSFRSQDAIAWNPRRFQFVSNASDYRRAVNALGVLVHVKPGDSSPASIAAQQVLLRVPEHSPRGELQILDARIVPGVANQSASSALLAAHLGATPHTTDQLPAGRQSPLGTLEWIRFKAVLRLPSEWRVPRLLTIERVNCAP
jgi:hypothetical protein